MSTPPRHDDPGSSGTKTNHTPPIVPSGPGRGLTPALGLRGVGTSLLRLRELSVVLVVAVLFIYFALAKSEFTSTANLGNIANLSCAAAILAAGEVMLLVCGEIDLSVGMTFAFAPFVMMEMKDHGVPLFPALLIALLVCCAFGMFNGVVTVLLGLPSFITTLGSIFLIHGITLQVSSAFPRPAPTDGFLPHLLGGWQWSYFIWAVAIALVMQIVLTSTRWGAYTVASGANPLAAAEAGIKVRTIKIRAFVVSALFAGLAGVIEGIHITQSFDPNAGGNDLMFKAIAGAVIGGTALLGGSGTVIGAFFGVFLLGILENGFTLQGISANTFFIIEGVAIILAMVLNTQLRRFRRGASVA